MVKKILRGKRKEKSGQRINYCRDEGGNSKNAWKKVSQTRRTSQPRHVVVGVSLLSAADVPNAV